MVQLASPLKSGLATLTGMLASQPRARPEVACRYWAGRVALRKTARPGIVPQVREEVNRRGEK